MTHHVRTTHSNTPILVINLKKKEQATVPRPVQPVELAMALTLFRLPKLILTGMVAVICCGNIQICGFSVLTRARRMTRASSVCAGFSLPNALPPTP